MRLYTGDGAEVYVPMDHLRQHESVIAHLEEVVSKVLTNSRTLIKETFEMGRVIGKSDLVETDGSDQIVYAVRTGRGWPTRFAMNRESRDCSKITVIMKRQGYMKYRMLTAYVGEQGAKEPGDFSIRSKQELNASNDFWSGHALVWGSQEIEPSSIVRGTV